MTQETRKMLGGPIRSLKRPGISPLTARLVVCLLAMPLIARSGSAEDIESSMKTSQRSEAGPETYLADRETQTRRAILLAQLEFPNEPTPRSPRRAAADSGVADADTALIATLSQMPLPSYVAPVQSTSPGWNRGFGAVRSGKLGPRIDAVAPGDHTGLSFSTAPRLWWRLDGKTEHTVQITILDERSIDPIFQVELAGPHEAGLHVIDLSLYGRDLKPGIDYRWFVTMVVDAERPSRNSLSEGAIRVLPESDSRRARVAEAPLPTRGHELAGLGVWYDAFDFFSALAVKHPEVIAIQRDRDRLTQTVLGESSASAEDPTMRLKPDTSRAP